MLSRRLAYYVRNNRRTLTSTSTVPQYPNHGILPSLIPRITRVASMCRLYSSKTSEPREQVKKCQFCGSLAPLGAHLCHTCRAPAPIPESVSYYDFFPNLPAAPPSGSFSIDVRSLRREFLKMQQKVHPDNFSNDDKKRLVAESTSALLNKAYTTLQAPLSRAEYILQRHDIEMASEGEKLTDGEVLMTVMEMREQIEDATSESDLDPVKQEVKKLIEDELGTLESSFSAGDFDTAKTSAVRLRYWQNIQKAALDWEEGSEIVLEH